MDIERTAIEGVLIIWPRRFADARGWFQEAFEEGRYRAAGIADRFVQDNVSFSGPAFTVRGLHFQKPPFVQAKLLQVLAGRILDVQVDLRPGSPSFGRHVAVVLTPERQIFVPGGFAHGFCTLVPDSIVHYKCSAPYSSAHEGGILWHDPDLGIDWPTDPGRAVVTDKDRRLPRLRDLAPVDWGMPA